VCSGVGICCESAVVGERSGALVTECFALVLKHRAMRLVMAGNEERWFDCCGVLIRRAGSIGVSSGGNFLAFASGEDRPTFVTERFPFIETYRDALRDAE